MNGHLDRCSSSKNLGTNLKELHTPTSTPKKLKGDNGDKKNKLELDMVFCDNETWWKADIVFEELSKWKSVFVGKIVETPSIWHLLHCKFFDWD